MPEDDGTINFLFDAYNDLSTCRAAEGPIPWSAARLYASDAGLDNDAFTMFWKVIRAMDFAERDWVAKNRPSQEPTNA